MKSKILVLVLFLMLSSFVLAEEHLPQSDPLTFNPDDPASFDYVNGDYSTITDWSKVNWENIPPNRIPEIPAEQLDYLELNLVQHFEMSVDQIMLNLEEIEDLAIEVDEERAREAIKKKYGVSVVSLGESASIENGVLKAEKGNFDFAGKSKEWEIEVDSEGVINVLKPKEIDEKSITKRDHITIGVISIEELLTEVTTEKTFRTKNGLTFVVEDLSFENGQAHIKKGSSAKIGDYEISESTHKIDIYFDTTEHQGNYVAVSENSLKIGSTEEGTVKVIPQPGNKLFNMVKRDYSTKPPTLVPDWRDTMELTISGGDGLKVTSGKKRGRVPIISHQDGDGETKIKTGRMSIGIKNSEWKVIPPKPFPEDETEPIDMRNSVAFELVSDADYIEEDIFRTSSSNRFILLQDGKEVMGNNMGLEVSNKIEPNMMKTLDDLRVKYPLNFFGVDTTDPNRIQSGYSCKH